MSYLNGNDSNSNNSSTAADFIPHRPTVIKAVNRPAPGLVVGDFSNGIITNGMNGDLVNNNSSNYSTRNYNINEPLLNGLR